MPADNQITMTGRLVKDAEAGKGRGPGRFRMATYCSGSKAKDNLTVAYVTVKSFNMPMLEKGTKVRVVGQFDPWDTDDKRQVLDVIISSYDASHGITVVEDDIGRDGRQQSHQQRPSPAHTPSYEEEAF